MPLPSDLPKLAWPVHALEASLQSLLPGVRVEGVGSIGSTNTELVERRRLLPPGECPPPTLLVAEAQTAGRGRLGRSWTSAPGSSLTFSLGLELAPADWGGLSLAVGLAVAEALADLPGGDRIGLKWPNDLWLRGEDRKLAGILVEAQAGAHLSGARWTVVGIGINVLPLHGSGSGSGSDEGFRSGYACLQELGEPSAQQALLRIAPLLLRALLRFQAEGLAPLLATWARRDVLAGRRVTAGERQGVAEGIDAGGELLLRDDAGTLHRIASGEVSVRPC